ncbi:MAG: spermidine synthase [Cellulomonas sp. 73-92]|uniref:spermidine synthase n=1 Tax=Cellulomonas sp. 73-92 TaxID=1895740 RepID=UPI000928212F|nr:fused MFS/spermidine synthase [Cellulomonas sp. 73-92]OJV79703.1 MAG: spermidine synthase [Cellulomonas sp. 73-92]
MSRSASHRPPTPVPWPAGPVPIATGTAEVQRERDDPDGVTLLVNGVPSSHLDLVDPTRLEFEYMQQMAAVAARLPAGPLAAVHLGAAGCALARALDAARPGSRQLAVDVDPVLAELVRRWFDLPRSPALRIRVGDAREALATLPDGGADLVVRDAFAGDGTPPHLATREFTAEVARVLRRGGVYLANCADRPPLALARSEGATIASVFLHCALVAEPAVLRGRRYGNVVVAGTDDPDLLGGAALARALRTLPVPARILVDEELAEFVGRAPVRYDVPS